MIKGFATGSGLVVIGALREVTLQNPKKVGRQGEREYSNYQQNYVSLLLGMKVRACNLCERLEELSSGGSQSGKLTNSDLVRKFLAISTIRVYRKYRLLDIYPKTS